MLEALELIRHKGYLLILVTNQPDVATGHIDPVEFERMMDVFRGLSLDGIYVCMYAPGTGCACRKPKPGMLLQAQQEHSIFMPGSFM